MPVPSPRRLPPAFHRRGLALGLLCLAAAAAPRAGESTPVPPEAMPDEQPLRKANAYSLLLDEQVRPRAGYFPLGMLGDHGFHLLPLIGFNLTENIHTCYDFKSGKPCQLKPNTQDRGTYFYNIWAAHTLYRDRKTAHYGELLNSIDHTGTPRTRHNLRFMDPNTRRYVLDVARHTAKTVLERGFDERIFFWGIDNEWEPGADYSPEALALFRAWLPVAYDGDVDRFRRAWEDADAAFETAVPPVPDENRTRKGAWLDWRRFQEEQYTDFIRDYFAAIQEADPSRRPVVGKSTQCTFEMVAVARKRINNHALLAQKTRAAHGGWFAIDLYGHGDRNNYELNYLHNATLPPGDDGAAPAKGRLFATETNNHSGPGWQFAQLFWRNLANGVKAFNFFHLSKAGGKADYATFGFTYPDGRRRDKFFYAARFAAMIHRGERFWSESVPAPAAPRLAMLAPTRDIQVSGDTGVSWWDYPDNNRLAVYKHLRDAGFWVDVVDYEKLDATHLARYAGLVLVGAEHLSAGECAAIAAYVENGGVLVADTRPGYYDEHHVESRGLDRVLGIETKGVYRGIDVSPDDLWFNTPHGNLIRADGKIVYETTTARRVNEQDLRDNAKSGHIVLNDFGRGKALWFNTRLGVARAEASDDALFAAWLADTLAAAGLAPAYTVEGAEGTAVRVERPMVDARGNLAVVVAGTTYRGLPATTLRLAAPRVDAARAFFAASEDNALVPVEHAYDGDVLTLRLPAMAGAGIVYLSTEAVPLMGLRFADAPRGVPTDPSTPWLRPGESVETVWHLANPTPAPLPAGNLAVRALEGWRVEPATFETPALAPGALHEVRARVTAPDASPLFIDHFAYPVVARWSTEGVDRAVLHGVVSIDPPRAGADAPTAP